MSVLFGNLFVRYLLAIGFAAVAMGVQIVMLPWLAAGELQLPPGQVGWVQSAGLLPAVLLMLVGGAFADHPGSARLLPIFYLLLMACHGGMVWLLWGGHLWLPLLLLYGLLLGGCHAFIQPLRDKVLPRFVGSSQGQSLQLSVVQISLCVYVAQALGVALAGQVERLGLPTVLLLQCFCLLLAAWLFWGLLRGSGAEAKVKIQEAAVVSAVTIREAVSVRDGLLFVWRHRVLKHLVLLVGFNGFVHIGVFVVALPLLTLDVYSQDAVYFAGLQLVFVVGNIAATLGLLKRGAVTHPGRSILFCLLYTGVIMLAISAHPTAVGLFVLVFFWGVVAGVSASLGKGVLHQQVDERYRGRVLSVYLLALFGAAPLGALACGYGVERWGALNLFQFGGVLTLLLFVLYIWVKPLWEMVQSASE